MARIPGLTRPSAARNAVTSEYRNPFRSAAVSPERIDQGVDYAGRNGDPIYAIGPARVVEVYGYGGSSGWPDGSGRGKSGGWVSYQLTSGPLMGKIVYVTEGVQPAVRAGQQIDSSTVIAHFTGGGGIETGWAGPVSQGDQTLAYAEGQSDFGSGDIGGWNTEAGVTFSNLMATLGAPPGILQAGGVHGANGQIVNVKATQVSPGKTTASSGGGGRASSDCLFTLGGQTIDTGLFGYHQTLPSTCVLTRSQARAVLGGTLILLGGAVLLVGTLVLAAYGLKATPAGGPAAAALNVITPGKGSGGKGASHSASATRPAAKKKSSQPAGP